MGSMRERAQGGSIPASAGEPLGPKAMRIITKPMPAWHGAGYLVKLLKIRWYLGGKFPPGDD